MCAISELFRQMRTQDGQFDCTCLAICLNSSYQLTDACIRILAPSALIKNHAKILLMFKNSLGIWLTVRLYGVFTGTDEFDNRYYRERRPVKERPERRWVLYQERPEGSAVPPLWQAWLTHTTDETPQKNAPEHPWQKPHRPNRTGTPEAHRPPGSLLGTAESPRLPYDPWCPSDSSNSREA